MTKPDPHFKVLVGINYPPARRADPGDIVSDIPACSVPWLLASGRIAPAKPPKPPKE